MWKRGKCSRSNRTTRQPCWASSVETVLPAGPPPMTTTSTECSPLGEAMLVSSPSDTDHAGAPPTYLFEQQLSRQVCRQTGSIFRHRGGCDVMRRKSQGRQRGEAPGSDRRRGERGPERWG